MSAADREPPDDAPQDEWLEALRGAWQQGPAPAPHRPLAEEDPATRAAVRWVRDAWLALPVPAARAPRSLPRAEPPPVVHLRWRRVAAAAALLLALGVPLLVVAARHAGRSRAPDVAPVAEAPAPPAAPTLDGAPCAEPPAAQVAAVDEHHLELRSGPVRLYLITDSPPSHAEVPR